MAEKHTTYILIGSNIEPGLWIPRAINDLSQYLDIVKISNTWENPPVGSSGPNFYNTAVMARTELSAHDLVLKILRPIELKLGRVRTSDKYAPRTIDLDIILYDDNVIEPRIFREPFIIVPMADILPELKDPVGGLSLETAASRIVNNGEFIPHPEVLQGFKHGL